MADESQIAEFPCPLLKALGRRASGVQTTAKLRLEDIATVSLQQIQLLCLLRKKFNQQGFETDWEPNTE